MGMGSKGMADMGEMEMPLPDNTLPMMSGQGPFGAVEMGGMFTVLKVRDKKKAITAILAGMTILRVRSHGYMKESSPTQYVQRLPHQQSMI
jgi:hypothetical protein